MVLWSKQKKGEKDMRNLVFSLIGDVQNIHEESLIGFSHILEEPFSFRKSSHSIDGHSKLQKLKGLRPAAIHLFFIFLRSSAILLPKGLFLLFFSSSCYCFSCSFPQCVNLHFYTQTRTTSHVSPVILLSCSINYREMCIGKYLGQDFRTFL